MTLAASPAMKNRVQPFGLSVQVGIVRHHLYEPDSERLNGGRA